MNEYIKESLIPLQLFNFYDNMVFDSFDKIISSSSPHNRDPQKYLTQVAANHRQFSINWGFHFF